MLTAISMVRRISDKTTSFRFPSIATVPATLFFAVLAMLLVAIGCASEPEIREVEVTREVPVTQQVPVTVETVQTIEVTREVPMVEEVPVTVTVPQTVEVTREVETIEMVEVTREVPVTRVVQATPTPAPTVSPTDAPTATPAPTLTPTVSVTPAPTNDQSTPFLRWEMQSKDYGSREIFQFQNTALDYTSVGPAPTITYWCDTRSDRAMYINWHVPITVMASGVPSSSRDPFSKHRDIPLYALVEYADDLLEFVDDLDLSEREQREADEIWDKVQRRWFVGPATPPALTDDPTPDDLVYWLDIRTLRKVDIDLSFFEEIIDPDQRLPHGPPALATITGAWLVLSDRTQINQGSLGELRRAINRSYSPNVSTAGTRPVMTATIKGPGQPVITIAQWDIDGIRQVLSHCQAIRSRVN